MPLKQIKKVIVHDAIIENILKYIREQNLQPGDKILSERKLSSLMQVSRSSVREALKALEYNGLLEIRHGGGAFIKSLDNIHLKSYQKDERDYFVALRNLIDARRMIEERVVQDVTPVITEDQIRELYDMEDYQLGLAERGEIDEGSKYELPNMNFELAITAMLNNPYIYDMHKRVESTWKKIFRTLSTTPFPARERYNHHIGIIKGMESGRTREAVKAMSYHNSILVKYIDDEIRKLDEGYEENDNAVTEAGSEAKRVRA